MSLWTLSSSLTSSNLNVRLRKFCSNSIFPELPTLSWGELLLGGMKSTHPNETARIFEALQGISILQADAGTAAIYARLRWRLEKEGEPIPQNDIWIAAATIQAGVPLISRDRHFLRIPELRVLSY